jgi:hypothetical protein
MFLPAPRVRTHGRLYVVFDEFDENEGAWVDDSDEWQWVPVPRGGLLTALPVAGAWRPGLYAGPVEKIYLTRSSEHGNTLLVKWKGMVRRAAMPSARRRVARRRQRAAERCIHMYARRRWRGHGWVLRRRRRGACAWQAHIHCQWVPQAELEVDPNNKRTVQRFLKATASEAAGGDAETWELEGDESRNRSEEEPYSPDLEVVERVIAVLTQEEDDLPPKYLVKWRGLPYASCTWESCRTLLTERTHHERAPRAARAARRPPPAAAARVRCRSACLLRPCPLLRLLVRMESAH